MTPGVKVVMRMTFVTVRVKAERVSVALVITVLSVVQERGLGSGGELVMGTVLG
jgi:hypothetical protein